MSKILQLHECIDELESFVDDPKQNRYYIGGIVGSNPFKLCIESVLRVTEFPNICVIEGCQDYIGLMKESMFRNHFYYADFIEELKIPDYGQDEGYDRGYMIWNPMKIEYGHRTNIDRLNTFDFCIINDAQLIPPHILNKFVDSYMGKLIIIFDPYEKGGEFFNGYPRIVDSLTKQSVIDSMARSVYNVSTRSLDKSVRCSVKEGKINKRSLGKSNVQYILTDKYLMMDLWDKQIKQRFRKGQKLWVMDDRIFRYTDMKDGRIYTITKNTLLVVDMVPVKGDKIRLRVWNSKFTFYSCIAYKNNYESEVIHVVPANAITIDQMRYHKFQDAVLVMDKELTNGEKYLVLKNTNNLVVGV